MNLQVTIGKTKITTTPSGLVKDFHSEDSKILREMFNLYPILTPGSTISQYTNGVRYEILCIK